MFRLKPIYSFIIITIAIVVGSITTLSPHAQDPVGATIQLTGQVTSIQGQTIVIDGLSIDISNTTVSIIDIDIDSTVTVIGVLQQQTVIATTVIIVVNPTQPTATITPEVTPELTPEVTVEPTVEATAEITAEPPAESTPVVDAPPLIVIEGPVQTININVITVFDFDIQIDASNPILTDLQIGDNVRVEGNLNFEGSKLVIVVVNITIIDIDIFIFDSGGVYVSPPTGIPAGCKVSKNGKIKCSKKKTKKNSKKSSKKS